MTIQTSRLGPLIIAPKQDPCHEWFEENGKLYKIGTILEYIADGEQSHGPVGHRVEIASIRQQKIDEIWFWCHGVRNIVSYSETSCQRLRIEYPYGNFGVDSKTRQRCYKIVHADWDE